MRKQLLAVVLMLACLPSAKAVVVIDTVPVGNPGNANDTHGDGYGGVAYTYNIGKYEVTAGQYAEFLNAVAGVDTYRLYSTEMWSSVRGCKVERFGGGGTKGDPYQYRVASDWADRPVNYVSWGDAARFSNWLHNGQPTGAQNLTTTEDGSYFLIGAMTNAELLGITRALDATWVIPSEDEWYKAAYHYNDGVTGNYFDYPMSSDSVPSNDLEDPDPGNNATFYDSGFTIGSPYNRTELGAHQNSDSPYGTFDQAGNVYVSDEWLNRIAMFTPDGEWRGAWGAQGGADGEVDQPSGIAFDSEDNLYVVDTGNNRVQKFTKDGQFLAKWGRQGSGDGEFDMPWGISIDTKGDIYIADWRNDRIQKFAPDGRFLMKFGSSGSEDGEFNRPADVAVDKE